MKQFIILEIYFYKNFCFLVYDVMKVMYFLFGEKEDYLQVYYYYWKFWINNILLFYWLLNMVFEFYYY